MLIIICGLIGSGKTTFAMNNFEHYTDLDDMPAYTPKSEQIRQTKTMLGRYENVGHITCFPTEEEYLALKDLNPQWVWINTSLEQAKENILNRNRPRDMADLQRVLNYNINLLKRARRSTIRFRLINMF